VDHRHLGTAFIILGVLAGLVGGVLSLGHSALHGPILIVFSALPALIGGFGNWLVPAQAGARGLAMPRLGLLSLAFVACGFGVTLAGLQGGALLPLLGFQLGCMGLLLCAISLLATLLNERPAGCDLSSLPPFALSQLFACSNLAVALPLLAGGIASAALRGGAAYPLTHLFSAFGYPGFCAMLLPGFGLAAEIVPAFAGGVLAGRRLFIGALAMLASGSLLFWAHTLLRGGLGAASPVRDAVGAALILLPSLAMAGCLMLTLFRGRGWSLLRAPCLMAMAFVVLLPLGAIRALAAFVGTNSGSMLQSLHESVALATVCALFGGFYFWIGKMSGRPYPERLARLQLLFMLAGGLTSLSPGGGSIAFAAGAACTSVSLLMFVAVLLVTLTRARGLPANPWGPSARGPEWKLPSPLPGVGDALGASR